jgi:carbonic anhydrase
MGNVTELLSKVQPAVYQESKGRSPEECNSQNPDFVESVADANVKRSVLGIVNRSFILEKMIQSGEVAIIGGKHDLATGQVNFFEETWMSNRSDLIAGVSADAKVISS